MISNSVKFLLNDKILEIKNPDPNQTILNYIRTELKKTGTKEGCSEGGCGACTIVLGELVRNDIKYSSIDSYARTRSLYYQMRERALRDHQNSLLAPNATDDQFDAFFEEYAK